MCVVARVPYQQITPVALGVLLGCQDLRQRLIQLVQGLLVDSLMLGAGRGRVSDKSITLNRESKVPSVCSDL